MSVFVGQDVELTSTITENGSAIDISGGSVVFEYYLPGNSSAEKDGDFAGTIVSGPAGTVEGVATSVLEGTYRIQAAVTISGKTYRAETTCFVVSPVGSGC